MDVFRADADRAGLTCTSRGLDTSTPSGRAMFQMMGELYAMFDLVRSLMPKEAKH